MIENQMKDAEFLQFADDLIDFFVYFIADRKQPTFRHQTVNKVIMYINDELENDLTVESIANNFHISTSHLSRIFREHVGITLVEYLNVRRVEESQYYLRHTNKSITSISDQFHFCNQSYFTRIFKNIQVLHQSISEMNFIMNFIVLKWQRLNYRMFKF